MAFPRTYAALTERLDRPWIRAAVAVAMALVAIGATGFLTAVSGRPYFFGLFPALLAASLLSGARAGLGTTAIFIAYAAYRWLGAPDSFDLDDPGDLWRVGGLAVSAVLVTLAAARVRALTLLERRLRLATEREMAARAEAEEAVRRGAARLAALQALTAALSAARTPADVAAVILRDGVPLVDASGAIVCWPDPAGGYVSHRSDRGVPAAPERLPRDARFPAMDVLRTGRAVWLPTEGAIRAAYPHLEASRAARGEAAWAAVPLVLDGVVLAAMGVAFPARRSFDEAERAWLGSIAELCAQALDRARLLEAEQDARRRAEAAEEDARRGARLQEQLMGVVGHDLRTPLSSILMAAGVARRGPVSEAQAAALDRIGGSAARMSEIIRDLLDVARARSGLGLAVVPRPVGLEGVCRTAVAELQQVHPGRLVRITVDGDDRVDADAARLVQAISNLVGNALQHGGDEGEVTVSIGGGAREAAIAVHNLGPPIPPAVMERLIEPFHRGSGGGSVGLGLFIVREIARAHGGRVDVCSDAVHGTTFTLCLPRGAGDALTSFPPTRPAAS